MLNNILQESRITMTLADSCDLLPDCSLPLGDDPGFSIIIEQLARLMVGDTAERLV